MSRRQFIRSIFAFIAATVSGSDFALAQDAADRATSAQVASERDTARSQPQARPNVEVTPAYSTSVSSSTSGTNVFVGAITITGLRKLAPADFADLIADAIGRSLSPDNLSALANSVALRIRTRGFPLGMARIDAQRVTNGILVIQADEGRIDEIRIEGTDNASVREALAPLSNGMPVRMRDIEHRLLIAGDIDGIRIKKSRFFREGDRGVLLVEISYNRVTAYANLSNQGTRPIGPEQARIEVNFNGLLDADDSLSLSYSAAPFQPRELQFGFIRYEKRLNASGTELALSGSGTITSPGAYLDPLDIKNRSWFVGASVLQPLLRRKKESYWLLAEIGLRNLSQWRGGVRTRHDRLAVGRATVYGYTGFLRGRLRMSATLSQGFNMLGATQSGDPLASRRDADASFTAGNVWTDWTRDLGDNFSLRLAAQGQLSSQPLLISEEAGLGGTTFLRGYDWGERTGDQGIMGMAELRYSIANPLKQLKRAQIYTFLDGGTVSNHDSGFGGGSLASTGGGVRLDVTSQFGINLEVAVPLTGLRYDTGDRTPKINFGVAQSF